ncbi:MAG: Fic family protein [Mangrovibacterium sp.]
MEIQQLLSQADRQIGRLDMYSEYIPNIELFISMHVAKEATQSSKIEGIQTNIEDAFLEKEDLGKERRDDWEEVQNYISAMNQAIAELDRLPLSSRLIRDTHRILLKSVRGQHKLPGEFRRSQNWIDGASINNASFIPPECSSIPELMNDLEKFVHNEDFFFPDLLKIALIHYQFETVHPFLDGNGRVGRLLITLYLVDKNILKSPILYLSDFFERNRTLYYDKLMRVRTHNDITQWFKFFLEGVIDTAKNAIKTFDAILRLKKEKEELVQGSYRSHHILKILESLYQNPITNAPKVVNITSISMPTAYKIIREMEEFGILKEITGSKRGQTFAFEPYINLF